MNISNLLLFGGWLFPSLDELYAWLMTFLYKMFILIDGLVYNFMADCWVIIIQLASARIAGGEFAKIIDRMYILIGVLVLFFVTYSLLKVVADPDNLSKGDTAPTKIVMNIVTSIALVALMPTIFRSAFAIQDSIIKSDVIGKVIFGSNSSTGSNIEEMGRELAATTWTAFFYPMNHTDSAEWGSVMCMDSDGDESRSFAEVKDDYMKNGKWRVFKECAANVVEENENIPPENVFEYVWFISFLGGAFLCYMLISYMFDLGIRVIKIFVLQVLAPLCVLLRIVPGKSKVFDTWTKNTVSAFVEVFIRLFMVYIVAFVVGQVPNIISNGSGMTRVFIIMGTVAFAKQAPALIGEIFGIKTGDMGLGIMNKLKEGGGLVAAAGATALGADLVKRGYGAVKNGHNEWKNAEKGNKLKTLGKSTGSALKHTPGALLGAMGAGIAGAYAGRKSGSLSEAIKAGDEASNKAIERRLANQQRREEYGGGPKGAIKGRYAEAVAAFDSWASSDSVIARDLQNRNTQISAVSSASKAVDTQAATLMDKFERNIELKAFGKLANGQQTLADLRKYVEAQKEYVNSLSSKLNDPASFEAIKKEHLKSNPSDAALPTEELRDKILSQAIQRSRQLDDDLFNVEKGIKKRISTQDSTTIETIIDRNSSAEVFNKVLLDKDMSELNATLATTIKDNFNSLSASLSKSLSQKVNDINIQIANPDSLLEKKLEEIAKAEGKKIEEIKSDTSRVEFERKSLIESLQEKLTETEKSNEDLMDAFSKIDKASSAEEIKNALDNINSNKDFLGFAGTIKDAADDVGSNIRVELNRISERRKKAEEKKK